jgi:hypothetical protein
VPTNYYPQKTRTELEALLSALQDRASQGQVYMSGGSGMPQIVRGYTGAARVEVEIKRVLYSLFLLQPNIYDDPYASRIRRTRTRYTYS